MPLERHFTITAEIMNTRTGSVEIKVLDSKNHPLENAVVLLEDSAGRSMQLAYDRARELYTGHDIAFGIARVTVSVIGYESQDRTIDIGAVSASCRFHLGMPGDSYTYIDGVKFPYSSSPAEIGVIVHPAAGGDLTPEKRNGALAARHLDDSETRPLDALLERFDVVRESGAPRMKHGDREHRPVARWKIIRRGAGGAAGLARGGNPPVGDADLRALRRNPNVIAAGPVVAMNDDGPVIMTNHIVVQFRSIIVEEEMYAILRAEGLGNIRRVPGESCLFTADADEGIGEEINEIIEHLLNNAAVSTAGVSLAGGDQPDAVNPNDFLWPTLWDRRLIRCGEAWELLQNHVAAASTFGDPSMIIGVVDNGVCSTNFGMPDNPDFRGRTTGGVATTLAAGVASARATITVASAAGFAMGNRIDVGSESNRRIYNIAGNQLTIDPLYNDHPAGTEVRLVGGAATLTWTTADVAATTSSITLASAAGLNVGDSIAIGPQGGSAPAAGTALTEDVVIRGIAGNVLTTTPVLALDATGASVQHAAGRSVESRRKVYKYFDFWPGTFGPDNDSALVGNNHHGTACAGVAAASGNNNIGVAGSAPGVRIMGIIPEWGITQTLAESYLWSVGLQPYTIQSPAPPAAIVPLSPPLIDPGADIISCSQGFGRYSMTAPAGQIDAIVRAMTGRITRRGREGRGTLMFFSAGNDDVPQEVTRWSAHASIFSCAASGLSFDTATGQTSEIKASYSSYSNPGGAPANEVEWCAPSGVSNNFEHHPPVNHWVVSTDFSGRGSMPGSSTTSTQLDYPVATVLNARPQVTIWGVAAGATHIDIITNPAWNPVFGAADFNAGEWIRLEHYDSALLEWVQINTIDAANNRLLLNPATAPASNHIGTNNVNPVNHTLGLAAIAGNNFVEVNGAVGATVRINSIIRIGAGGEWVRVTGVTGVPPARTRLDVTPNLAAGYPLGDPVFVPANTATEHFAVGSTEINVASTAGFAAGRWLLLGDPAATGCEATHLHQVLPGNRLRISGPMNAFNVGGANPVVRIHSGPTDYFDRFNGTSSATPLSAGVGALVLTAKPSLTWVEVRQIMRDSADRINATSFGVRAARAATPQLPAAPAVDLRWSNAQGESVVDAAGALQLFSGTAAMLNAVPIHTRAIRVNTTTFFHVGHRVRVGNATDADKEIREVVGVDHLLRIVTLDADLTVIRLLPPSVTTGSTTVAAPGAPIGATKIPVSDADTFVVGQTVLISDGVNNHIAVIKKIEQNPAPVVPPCALVIDVAVTRAIVAGETVQGGLIALRHPYFGYGRLNAEWAVSTALDYSHDMRDLMIRCHAGDDGVGATDPSLVALGSPDIWVRTLDPLTDYRNALPSGYGTPDYDHDDGYDVVDLHQSPRSNLDSHIYARIRNRGADLHSLDAWARIYVYRSRTNEPFVVPVGWDDARNHTAIPAGDRSGTYLIGAERLLFNAPADENIPALNGGIAPGEHFIVKTTWGQGFYPPSGVAIANRMRTHILVEITPHDGALAGGMVGSDNNLASREITFAEVTFLRNTVDPIEESIEVSRDGSATAIPFRIRLNDPIGYFETEAVRLEITRRTAAGVEEVTVYGYSGGAWTAANPRSGLTFSAPVLAGGGAAAGDQIEIFFEGSFTVSSDYDLVMIRLVLQSHAQPGHPRAILAEYAHQLLVTAAAPYYSDAEIVSSNRPRFHVFAEMAKLDVQDAARAFGPVSADRFHLTSGFTSAHADVRAFAVVTGTVFVQRVWDPVTSVYDPEVVNLILRPLRQSKIDFTPVKYFIYRGLRLDDLFELDGSDLRVQDDPSRSDLIADILDQQAARKSASDDDDIPDVPLSNALGWDHEIMSDPDVQPTTDPLDKYFYSSDVEFQFPIARRGRSLGTFHNGRPFGFEIVLEEGDFRPTLEFARKPVYEIDLTAVPGTAADIRSRREEILNFLDPAAYYGMHYDIGVEDGAATHRGADLYTNVVAMFHTRNTVYLDIRNENGYSLDYYGNYTSAGATLKIGSDLSPAGFIPRAYQTTTWPVYMVTASQVRSGDENYLFVALRVADNLEPLVYLDHGTLITRSESDRFVAGENLLLSGSLWTKELGFMIPNTPNPSVAGQRLYVANAVKLHYARQRASLSGVSDRVVKSEHYYDNVFGPLNTTMFWNDDDVTDVTKWVSAQDRRFIDFAERTPPYSYMAERGIAVEPAGEGGDEPCVIFYASAIDYFRDSSVRPRKIQGINGGYSTRGGFVENSSIFDGFDLQIEKVEDTDADEDVQIPRLVAEIGSDRSPNDLLILGITQEEYEDLREAAQLELSPNHQMSILLRDEQTGADPETATAFRNYRLGVRGWKKMPESDGTHVQHDAYPGDDIRVYTIDGNFFVSTEFVGLEELAHYSPTPEERVADSRTEPDELIRLDSVMEDLANGFGESVAPDAIPNNQAAKDALESVVIDYGEDILEQARIFARANYDDRPLYWARLQMGVRFKEHDYLATNAPFREQLTRIFEERSRGVSGAQGVSFSGVAGRKVLVIGFDPYALSPDIRRKNPAGVAALALHGEPVGGTGKIQSIVLPVRYSDFTYGWISLDDNDEADTRGLIEEIIPKYLDGPDKADVIVVLGENGGKGYFDIERFAGRANGMMPDNESRRGDAVIAPGNGWPQFVQGSLDIGSMLPDPFPPASGQVYYYDQSYESDAASAAHPTAGGTNDNADAGGLPAGTARKGSGGNFLFNEAFYRIARLRDSIPGCTVRVGLISMPAPENMAPATTMQDVAARVKTLIDNA